jgi:hypothetical protein
LVVFTPYPEQIQLLADHNARIVLTKGIVSVVVMDSARS